MGDRNELNSLRTESVIVLSTTVCRPYGWQNLSLTELARDHEFVISYEPYWPLEMGAAMTRKYIFVPQKLFKRYRRYRIAHEMAHAYLNHGGNHLCLDDSERGPQEAEADLFAAYLLMPVYDTDVLLAMTPSEIVLRYCVPNYLAWFRLAYSYDGQCYLLRHGCDVFPIAGRSISLRAMKWRVDGPNLIISSVEQEPEDICSYLGKLVDATHPNIF